MQEQALDVLLPEGDAPAERDSDQPHSCQAHLALRGHLRKALPQT